MYIHSDENMMYATHYTKVTGKIKCPHIIYYLFLFVVVWVRWKVVWVVKRYARNRRALERSSLRPFIARNGGVSFDPS